MSTFSVAPLARSLLGEKRSLTGAFYSLVAPCAATLAYIIYLHHRKNAVKTAISNKHAVQEDDPLKNCDYASIKVTKILVHPIKFAGDKSCRGTSVPEVRYTEEGLENDRHLAIIDANTHRVLTARGQPKMVLIHPQIFTDGSDAEGGRVEISFPEGSGCETFSIPLKPSEETLKGWKRIEDIELWGRYDIDGYICQSPTAEDCEAPTKILSQFLGRDVFLVLKGPRARPCKPTYEFPVLEASARYQDGYPLLVASEESLQAVQERLRGEVGIQGVADRWSEDSLVMERFRPNIVLSGAGVPWAEDVWESIQVGANASSISLVSKCARCLLPNVDPDTGVRDAAVPYKVLMKFRTNKDPARLRKPCFGCNGVPAGAGVVRVGDAVAVLKFAPQ